MSSECPSNRACVNQKCVNPCPQPCGQSTNCLVVNHSPICTCKDGNTGNPFTRCFPIQRKSLELDERDRKDELVYPFAIFFHRAIYFLRSTSKPLRSFSLRSILRVPRHWRCSILFLLSQLLREPAELSTRVHRELRLPQQQGLHQAKVRGPLSWILWPVNDVHGL